MIVIPKNFDFLSRKVIIPETFYFYFFFIPEGSCQNFRIMTLLNKNHRNNDSLGYQFPKTKTKTKTKTNKQTKNKNKKQTKETFSEQ